MANEFAHGWWKKEFADKFGSTTHELKDQKEKYRDCTELTKDKIPPKDYSMEDYVGFVEKLGYFNKSSQTFDWYLRNK
jgi:hypothetical protein